MKKEAWLSLGISMPLLVLGGCSEWQGAEMLEVDGYQLRIKTDPDPLQVGETARITVLLESAAGDDKTECGVQFRQYMPGMEMSGDDVFHPLKFMGRGRYEGRSGEFSMGGDWELEFDFTCGNDKRQVVLKRHLEWPE